MLTFLIPEIWSNCFSQSIYCIFLKNYQKDLNEFTLTHLRWMCLVRLPIALLWWEAMSSISLWFSHLNAKLSLLLRLRVEVPTCFCLSFFLLQDRMLLHMSLKTEPHQHIQPARKKIINRISNDAQFMHGTIEKSFNQISHSFLHFNHNSHEVSHMMDE